MDRRTLGRTDLQLRPIAFGAFKIGRNQKIKYAQSYELPSDAEVDRLLNGILDLGINLIDTAPAYGTSEERIGRHVSHRRGEFFISTKIGETFEQGRSAYDFSANAIQHSVQRSLQRLRVDVLDLVFIHSDGDDLRILEQTDAVETLISLRDQGLVRFIGMSGKTPQGAERSLSWADVLMVEYHAHDRSHEHLLADAAKHRAGVLVKKPLASGSIPPADAIPFILRRPEVASLVVGGLSLVHFQENLRVATASM